MTEAVSTTSLADVAEGAIVDAASMLTALAAIATLLEQNLGLQRQIGDLKMDLAASELRARDLTDAKFVTYRTLIDSQAEKVALALEATEKAIDKAERATEKAIDKAEAANDKRFESVNEFRSQMNDMIARFATLERVDLLYTQANQRIDEMGTNTGSRISELTIRLTAIEASERGAKDNKNGLYAAIGGVVGVLVILGFIFSIMPK